MEKNTYKKKKKKEKKKRKKKLRTKDQTLATKRKSHFLGIQTKTLIVIVIDTTLKHQIGRGGPNPHCVSLSHAR